MCLAANESLCRQEDCGGQSGLPSSPAPYPSQQRSMSRSSWTSWNALNHVCRSLQAREGHQSVFVTFLYCCSLGRHLDQAGLQPGDKQPAPVWLLSLT